MSQKPLGRDKIRDVIREYILEEFLPGEDSSALTNETALISSGILDSIAVARLVSYLEDQFKIQFKAKEVSGAHLDTVDSIVEKVERLLSR